MSALTWLIPCALFLGGIGLVAFLWSLRTKQFEDLDGAAWRALEDEPPKPSLPPSGSKSPPGKEPPTRVQ
jgi:cbb3-type cytochrome oxidase maturation protein